MMIYTLFVEKRNLCIISKIDQGKADFDIYHGYQYKISDQKLQ